MQYRLAKKKKKNLYSARKAWGICLPPQPGSCALAAQGAQGVEQPQAGPAGARVGQELLSPARAAPTRVCPSITHGFLLPPRAVCSPWAAALARQGCISAGKCFGWCLSCGVFGVSQARCDFIVPPVSLWEGSCELWALLGFILCVKPLWGSGGEFGAVLWHGRGGPAAGLLLHGSVAYKPFRGLESREMFAEM